MVDPLLSTPAVTHPAEATVSTPLASPSLERKKPHWDPQKNHGRQGHGDYTGCDLIRVADPNLKSGDACPDCAEYRSYGRLYPIDPGQVIVLEGKPLIMGTRYETERYRCSVCGKQFSAPLPKAAQRPKYDATSRSTLAINHYYLGYPFKRIELLQQLHGIPVSDGTQWDQMNQLYCMIQPIHQTLEQIAAEADRFLYDDTPNRLLDKSSLPLGRKGVYTTAIAAEASDAYPIFLFYTSTRQAGENIQSLLRERESDSAFVTMSDASASNIPKTLPEALLANWIFCFCLVHGRRRFYELYDIHTGEVHFVLEQLGRVYDNERYCKTHRYTPEQRLLHHQRYSEPVMELLKIWLTNQLVFHQIEQNSPLGEAITYLLKYWYLLTQFLRVVGAPIDNSLAERMIKVMIRYRRNSLFFRTAYGASVGDAMMSVMHTARINNVNVFDYLTTLQEHAHEVAAVPDDWLPWNYLQRVRPSAAA